MSAEGEALVRILNERDELQRRVLVLERKLLQLSDPSRDAEVVRKAYRRGYIVGRNAKRRGDPVDPAPEKNARTFVREAIGA